MVPDRLISRRGDIQWLPRSPDLTPQTFSCGDTSNAKFTSTVRGTLIRSKRLSGKKWQRFELQITIEQLLLERGHTMMEADAVTLHWRFNSMLRFTLLVIM